MRVRRVVPPVVVHVLVVLVLLVVVERHGATGPGDAGRDGGG